MIAEIIVETLYQQVAKIEAELNGKK